MENKNQYNQPGAPGDITPDSKMLKPGLTKSPADIKIQQLEEELATQQLELAKMRRDIGRLRNNISDLELMIRNRG